MATTIPLTLIEIPPAQDALLIERARLVDQAQRRLQSRVTLMQMAKVG